MNLRALKPQSALHSQWPVSRGFTLIELLVVITIIAILIAIILPTLRQARMSAQRVVCQSKLRQVFIADQIYMGDHRNWMPEQNSNLEIEGTSASSQRRQVLESYWAKGIRWCPTIEIDNVAVNPLSLVGGYFTNSPSLYFSFGYMRPRYNAQIIHRYALSSSDVSSSTTANLSGQFYRHPERALLENTASGITGALFTWQNAGALAVDVTNSLPVISDLVYASSSIGVPQWTATPHNGGKSKNQNAWVPPSGANHVWGDGSLTWQGWDTSRDPIGGDYRLLAYGDYPQSEGYVYLISGTQYILYARRGRPVGP